MQSPAPYQQQQQLLAAYAASRAGASRPTAEQIAAYRNSQLAQNQRVAAANPHSQRSVSGSTAIGQQKRTSLSLPDGDAQHRSAKRRKATDRYIPTFTVDSPAIVKDSDAVLQQLSQAYSKLQALEKKLDWTVTRKRIDISETLGITGLLQTAPGSSTKAGRLTPVRKVLQVSANHEVSTEDSKWTLKVSANIPDLPDTKFSHLLYSVSVQISSTEPRTNDEVVSWTTSADSQIDGITISRPYQGDTMPPLKVSISLLLNQYPERYKVLPQLYRIIGVQEDSLPNILAALWAYIKANGLQDSENKVNIRLDAALRSIISGPENSVPFYNISEWVIRNLVKPDPITFEHTISPDASQPTCLSIPFYVEDPSGIQLQAIYDSLTSSSRTKEILSLDGKIADLALQIKDRHSTRDFLAAFASDPKEFIKMWLDSQASDLEEYLSMESKSRVLNASAEELRRADFWKEQAWIDDAINVYASRAFQGKVAASQPVAAVKR